VSSPDLIDPSVVPADLAGTDAPGLAKPSLLELLWVFTRIGATSFGGGLTSWMMRVVIDERGWMTTDDFLTGLAMCQALPGVNVLNLAVWIGYRMGGGLGALLCCIGILAPACVIIAIMAMVFALVGDQRAGRLAFAGAAAAAIGLSLSVGVYAAKHTVKTITPGVLIALTAVLVGVLKVSIVPVVLTLGPLGILLEVLKERRRGA
jgi:chromate transporter